MQMMKKGLRSPSLSGLLLCGLAACGGGDANPPAQTTTAQAGSALSAEQMEKGIGPVTQVTLGALDAALARQGQEVFNLKCAACHKLTDRYVGPPLGDVLERRAPEYVMNMILNPAEMLERHPTARELLAQYMTPMPDQNLTEDEARAVLEYLRSAAASGGN